MNQTQYYAVLGTHEVLYTDHGTAAVGGELCVILVSVDSCPGAVPQHRLLTAIVDREVVNWLSANIHSDMRSEIEIDMKNMIKRYTVKAQLAGCGSHTTNSVTCSIATFLPA